MKIRKTLGIDLGTTNSVIALLDPTDSALITARDAQGHQTFPSVVAPQAQRLVVGWSARELRARACPAVSSVKRHMGLERRFAVGDKELTPVEVSARILEHCRDALAATLGDPRYLLDSAVITMPAYFNHNQIEDTRQAGERAGFEVVELLHEPTAAAIYYSWIERHGDATYLVYDLGGGTFDVSVIRRRFGDYEVLAVSGDPFLGGDDFDRLLATAIGERLSALGVRPEPATFPFLVRVAENIKIDLSERDCVSDVAERLRIAGWPERRGVSPPVSAPDRRADTAPLTVTRDAFQSLIKDKVHRTIDCCHEALARAKEKAGIRLSDIDYVILVGGSSRIPFVRDTIHAAFCNESLPEHVRCTQPLLHEPDLCVAYGAALRGASHGTRYIFPVVREEGGPAGALPDLELELGPADGGTDLELHWTSPVNVSDTHYPLTGSVRGPGAAEVRHGGSVRVRCFATGLTEEVFLDLKGAFTAGIELRPDTDNAMELTVCDNLGRDLVRIPACVRHRSAGMDEPLRSLGLGVLPTQLITKPLSIEVLDRGRRRVKQIVAPVGAALPGTFQCTCRTVDQSGRVVVPIFEENRVIKQMVIGDVDRRLPAGSPVDVEFKIDVKHNIEVRVLVREASRSETITLQGPPPPSAPTRPEVDAVRATVEELLEHFSGSYRSRVKARLAQLLKDLHEARFYEDEPKAIQRMAELRDLQEELERERGQRIEPPWARFTQLVHHCRILAAEVAKQTGRDTRASGSRDELVEYIRAQERFAERAYQDRNQALYRECWLNLEKYAGQLDDLRRASSSDPSERPASEEEKLREDAATEVERFRRYLSAVWKQVRAKGRKDLDERLAEVAKQSQGLSQRARKEPMAALREARRWGTEVAKVEKLLAEGRSLKDDEETTSGLLEGML